MNEIPTAPRRVRKPTYHSLARSMPVENRTLSARSFCIFVDETGHEDFAGQSWFGFGGVAGYGVELHRAARSWRAMKATHFGGGDVRLHASGNQSTPAQREAISDYFRASRLRRFAFIMAAPPLRLPQVDALKSMRNLLLHRLAETIDALPKVPDEIHLCFELCERAFPKIIENFPQVEFDMTDGQTIRLETSFTDKSAGSPWLEMADQIANRAQRQFRAGLPSDDLIPEFAAVFPPDLPAHARLTLMQISSVNYQAAGLEYKFALDGAIRIRIEGDGLKYAEQFAAAGLTFEPGISSR